MQTASALASTDGGAVMRPPPSVEGVLASFPDILRGIRLAEQRRDYWELVHKLLLGELDRRVSPQAAKVPDKLLMVKEAAKLMRLKPPAVYALVRDGKLRGFRYGGRVRIPVGALYEIQSK